MHFPLFKIAALVFIISTTAIQPLAAQSPFGINLSSRPKFPPVKLGTPSLPPVKIDWNKKILPRNPRDAFEQSRRNLQNSIQRSGKSLRESTQRQLKQLRESAQRETVRTRRSIGWEWNDKIRDPTVYTYRHYANKLVEAPTRAQAGYDGAVTRVPIVVAGQDLKFHRVPDGRGSPAHPASLRVATFSASGMVGELVDSRYVRWGKQLRVDGRLSVQRGSARLVVYSSEGAVIATSPWKGVGNHNTGLQASPPTNLRAQPLRDSVGKSAHFAAAVEISPGSEVTIHTISYVRD